VTVISGPAACGHLFIAAHDPVAEWYGLGAVALRYAALGLAVFPLRPGGKVPLQGSHGHLDATADPARIRAWWAGARGRNVGIATGQRSGGLLVIDMDVKSGHDGPHEFGGWLRGLGLTHAFDTAPYVTTPSGGVHLWVRLPPGRAVRSKNGVLPGVDIKGDDGYIVAPPSGMLRPAGGLRQPGDPPPRRGEPDIPVAYEWRGCACQVPEAPTILLDALDGLHATGNGGAGGGHEQDSLRDLPPTAHLLEHGVARPRDGNLARLAARLAAEGKSEGEAFGVWRAVAGRTAQDPAWPFSYADFARHWKGARKKGFGEVLALPAGATEWVQRTTAEAAPVTGVVVQPPVVVTKQDGLQAATAARWVTGQGPLRWGIDNQLWAYRNGVWVPGEDPGDDIVHARIVALLGDQFRHAHGTNIREVIRAQAGTIHCDPRPDLINFRNGLLPWQKGDDLKPHDPDVLSTVQLAVNWNPQASCPAFDRFLAGVLAPGDVPRMWEAIGYLLMPGNPLHKIFLLYGRGNNGKGVLLRVLTALIGQASVSSVSLHSLAEERFTRVSLLGKLANICGDIDATYIERTGLLKQLTGEDLITAEHKFRKPAQFTNWAVPLFSANEMPSSPDSSWGWLRRWEVFAFPNTFAGHDPALEPALRRESELAGIAVRAVAALRALMGRTPPAFSRTAAGDAAQAEFASYQDPLHGWLTEGCLVSQGAWADRRAAYASYTGWCEVSGGRRPLGKTKFYAVMRERFAETKRDGWDGYEGLVLRPAGGI
jgi:P4 family phage/plasmid primase-like protien